MKVSCLRWAGSYLQGPAVFKSPPPPKKKKKPVYIEGKLLSNVVIFPLRL